MANVSTPTALFEDADLKFDNFNQKRTNKRGSLVAQPGTELRGVKALFTVTVQAAANKAAGLTLLQQKALLGAIFLDLSYGNGSNNTHVFQDRPLTEMRLKELKAFETEVEGFGAGTGKGLAKAIVTGANELSFTLSISLGHVESIIENGLFGVGPEQMATVEASVRAAGDPLKALDADLEAKSMYVRFAPIERLAPEGDSGRRLSRWGNIPIDRVKEESDDRFISFPESILPIEVVDVAEPNATTEYTGIDVEVGDYRPVRYPATPADVEAEYERMPDTNAQEAAVADEVTTLYRRWDMSLNAMPTGPLKVTQKEGSTVFDVRAYYFPVHAQAELIDQLKMHAQKLAKAQDTKTLTVRFVSVAAVHDGVKVEDRFLPVLGWYATQKGDTEYATIPSLEYELGAEFPKLHIPPLIESAKFGHWVTALGMGDKDTMDVIVQSITRCLPLAVDGAYGFAGGKSWARQLVEHRFEQELLPRVGSPELVTKLQQLKQS